jgi:hypothetical protein
MNKQNYRKLGTLWKNSEELKILKRITQKELRKGKL